MNSIYRLFTGDYIDLSKIVTVTPIQCPVIGDEVWFDIHFQLYPMAVRITIRRKTMDYQAREKETEFITQQYDQFIADWQRFKNELTK